MNEFPYPTEENCLSKLQELIMIQLDAVLLLHWLHVLCLEKTIKAM